MWIPLARRGWEVCGIGRTCWLWTRTSRLSLYKLDWDVRWMFQVLGNADVGRRPLYGIVERWSRSPFTCGLPESRETPKRKVMPCTFTGAHPDVFSLSVLTFISTRIYTHIDIGRKIRSMYMHVNTYIFWMPWLLMFFFFCSTKCWLFWHLFFFSSYVQMQHVPTWIVNHEPQKSRFTTCGLIGAHD